LVPEYHKFSNSNDKKTDEQIQETKVDRHKVHNRIYTDTNSIRVAVHDDQQTKRRSTQHNTNFRFYFSQKYSLEK
jgi:hypothetical protein